MHILYHLPTEYGTINDKYLKDLDDGKYVDLEDLRADLRRKHDRLVDSGCIEKNNEDGNDIGSEKEIQQLQLNIRAYADLLQCCTQDIISFGIVDAAKDKELSNGNSKLAWKRLSEKFAGRNNVEKMKLVKQLNESRMEKKEDPDEWITV